MRRLGIFCFLLVMVGSLLVTDRSFAQVPDNTNLVSCWDLDENSGIRYDAYGSNDFTDNNTVGSAAGVVGQAAFLTAANAESLSTVNFPLNVSADYTILTWAKSPTHDTTFQPIVSLYPPWIIYLGHTDYNFAKIGGTYPTVVQPEGEAEGSTNYFDWNFLAAWYNQATNQISMSLNDGYVVSMSLAGSVIPDSTTLQIGFANSDAFFDFAYFDGYVDQTAIYQGVLSSAEITWIYNSGAGRACSELINQPTPTPTVTPTFTPVPSATPTPSGERTVYLSSGNWMTLERRISYGEISVVVAIGALLLVILLYALVRLAKLWLH